jgi:3-deoxy-manno-octulosonate cytidylyltransferase (CMP-KDO synthetase)
MDSVVVVIPARYESTRLPGKPLADICGKPMIQRVYERAAAARGVDRVLIATDDDRIREAVMGFGGDVAMTSSEHTTGTDRIAEAVGGLDCGIVVNVQGDLPLLDPNDVAGAVAPMLADASLPMATLMTAIRDRDEFQNPNVVKVVSNRNGDALYFSRAPIPHRRDGDGDGVLGHRHIGLYVYRREFLLDFARLQPTPLELAEKLEQLRALEHGHRIRVVEVEQAGVEVDTPQDLDMVRALVRRSGGGCHE